MMRNGVQLEVDSLANVFRIQIHVVRILRLRLSRHFSLGILHLISLVWICIWTYATYLFNKKTSHILYKRKKNTIKNQEKRWKRKVWFESKRIYSSDLSRYTMTGSRCQPEKNAQNFWFSELRWSNCYIIFWRSQYMSKI